MENTNGKLLEQLRTKRMLTQKEVAHKSGLSQALVSGIEVGVRELTEDTKQKVTVALGAPADYFDTATVTGYRDGDVPMTVLGPSTKKQRDALCVEFGELEHATAVSPDAPAPLSLFAFPFTKERGRGEKMEKIAQAGKLIRELVGEDKRGPVPDVTAAAEKIGVVVSPIGTPQSPSAALSSPARYTTAVIAHTDIEPSDERRFALSRELMRLCLTNSADARLSDRTLDRVTCAFLVPPVDMKSAIGSDAPLDSFPLVKASTGVPIHYLIDWARDCGAITPAHRKRLLSHYQARGWQIEEPVEVPYEVPRLVDTVVARAPEPKVINVDFRARKRTTRSDWD